MPKDTQDSAVDGSSYDKSVLTLLRAADERMLLASGNLAYLQLKAKVDRLK
jgi:hypothetical protein